MSQTVDIIVQPNIIEVEVTVGNGGGGSTPDATNAVKGKLKLANHLGGNADLPTVIKVEDVTVGDSSSKPANTKFVADSISDKVDKVAGKSLILDIEITRLSTVTNQDISNLVVKDGTKVLSDVNFSTAKDTKLSGIDTGAQVNAIDSITTTGTSGAATLVGKVLNIPQYSGGGGGGSTDWNDITNKPIVIGAGATQSDARVAIGAGTSNLTLGLTNTTAKAGDYTPSISDVTGLNTALSNKVDKVAGKSLINDTEITRLTGIATGATANDTDANLKNTDNHTNGIINKVFTAVLLAKINSITEIFTTALKTSYDNAVTWISTNGANVLSHLSSTSNPHNVTKTQVGLSNVDNTADTAKNVLTATKLLTARNINGVAFDGTANITITDATKEPTANKSIVLTSPDDVKFPTTKAVSDALALKAPLASPTFTGTVGGITKSMVGLGSVDDTPDTAKPVSTAQQTAIDAKVADNLTASTTVAPSKTAVNTALALKANIASPTFTGTPSLPTGTTAVTQTAGDNSTKLATTAYVKTAVDAVSSSVTLLKGSTTANNTDVTTNRYKDITVTGAAIGDVVNIDDQFRLIGTLPYWISAKVTATNTVRIYFTNMPFYFDAGTTDAFAVLNVYTGKPSESPFGVGWTINYTIIK